MPEIKKGSATKVVPANLVDYYVSKGWGLVGDTRVKTETGEKLLTPEKATKEVAKGSQVTGREELSARRGKEFKEREFGGTLEKVQAFGEGGLRGLTFGLLGTDTEERLRSEVNPGAALTGEITGALAGAFGVGTEGLLAKGLRFTPAGQAASLATKAEQAISATRAGKAGGIIAGSALEGGLFGAGQGISNLLLADKPLSAEAILAEAGTGALYGGIAGGVIGVGGLGLSKLGRRLEQKALKKANPIFDATSEVGGQARGVMRQSILDAEDVITRSSREIGTPGNMTTSHPLWHGRIAPGNPDLGGSLKAWRTEYGKALTAARKSQAKVHSYFGKTADDIMPKLEKMSPEKLSEGVEALNRFHIDAGDLSDLSGGVFKPREISAEIDALIGDVAKKAGVNVTGASGTADLVALAEMTGATDIGEKVKGFTGSDAAESMVKLWAIAQLGKAGSSALPKTGGLKGLGGALRRPGNTVTNIVSGSVGALGKLKSRAEAAVGAFARTAARTRRAAVPAASVALGKISFDPDSGVRPKKIKPAAKGIRGPVESRMEELARIGANPQRLQKQVAHTTSALFAVNPDIASMVQAGAMDRIQYLLEKMPKNPIPVSMGKDRWRATDIQISEFARTLLAADDPGRLIDELEAGKLTQETVNTVRDLYPAFFREVQIQIVQKIPEFREKMNYRDRVTLSLLFQVPVEITLRPDFIERMQLNFAERELESNQQDYSTPGKVGSGVGVTEPPTASQRIESR